MGTYPKKNSAEWFIDQLNVDNAKLLAFFLVLGFIGYHGILHLRYGPDSCTWLLSSGRYKGDREWQPYGCMLHKYSKTDARRCLRYLAFWEKYNSFAFIGDSRVEQLYEYFISVLKTQLDVETSYSTVDHRMPNYTYVDSKLRLSVTYTWTENVSKTMVDKFRMWQHSDQPPSVIVAGTGLSLVQNVNVTEANLEEYKRNLTRLVQPIDALSARGTHVLWKLLEAVDTSKLKSDIKINNNDIDAYNHAAVEILQHSATKMWNVPRLAAGLGSAGVTGISGVGKTSGVAGNDGLALSEITLRHSTQTLLNMFCNDHMNFNDGTCCAQPEPCTQIQMLTFALFFLCAVVVAVRWLWRWSQTIRQQIDGYSLVQNPPNGKQGPSPIEALAKLGMIMCYFYLCDRTNFFMKENKYYSEWSFWLPVGYVFALGLFFTDESKSSSVSRVLNRDQTNEWKGWMQLVILVYQVTGASKVLPIYMMVRALVSAYLFLTGYGHFYYTWKTGDTGLVRYFRVIFRLNFFTVVLCLTMNRPYQFYSFIPLVSFWYTLMFVILALPPHITPLSSHTVESKPYQYLYVVIKVIGLLAIVTILYMSEVFFQKIFVTRPWKALFVNSDDDIHQWWLDWKQDRYSVAYGMVFAAAYLCAQRHGAFDEARPAAWGGAAWAGAAWAGALAAAALLAYGAFAALCTDPSACTEVHSYIAFLPLVAYVALRNAPAPLRARHSGLFAWVGGITLELFASQSHIWLAADTHGVLVLAPAAPALNLLLTSYVFALTAHEIRALTAAVLPYAVPDDWRLVVRNLAVFLAVLVPIGVHHGMF